MSEKKNEEQTVDKGITDNRAFFSLRSKLLIGFTVLFTVVFAVAFYWFFTTASDLALGRIQEDLSDTVQAAVQNVDGDELLALAAEGEPNEAGFSDDVRFLNQMEWLETIHQIEPRAWPYLYIPAEGESQVFFVVDLLANYNVDSSAGFMESYTSTGYLILGLDELTFRLVDVGPVAYLGNVSDGIEDNNPDSGMVSFIGNINDWLSNYFPREFGMYGDKFGRWVSAYAPITNSDGELVAAMGIDFQADYVEQVRQSILDRVLGAFGVVYVILFVLVFAASKFFTDPIVDLTRAAEKIGEGDYEQDLSKIGAGRFVDEIGRMAEVFSIMVDKVYQRERSLLKQVAKLKIEIDSSKQKEEIEGIVASEFFQELKEKAGKMRKDRNKK